MIRDAPPALFHVLGSNTLFTADETDELKGSHGHQMLDGMWSEYLKTMSHDRRELLGHFSVQDTVFKVVGVGSVGTAAWRCCSSTA